MVWAHGTKGEPPKQSSQGGRSEAPSDDSEIEPASQRASRFTNRSGVVANCSAINNGRQKQNDAQPALGNGRAGKTGNAAPTAQTEPTKAVREGAGRTGNEAPAEVLTLQDTTWQRYAGRHAPAAATTAMRQTGCHDRTRAREKRMTTAAGASAGAGSAAR
jgi:hypothetical protein